MEFQHTLEKILGSRIKVRIIRTLLTFPAKGFGVRELAGILHIDHRSVSLAVKEFEQQNIVTSRVFGRSYAIYLNLESFFYPHLLSLLSAEQNLLHSLVETIKKHIKKKDVLCCALFGSIVEGKGKHNSDIDLLLIAQNKEKFLKKIQKLQEEILKKYGNPLSPLIFTQEEFAETNPQLKENILKNNYLIYGKW